MDNDNHVYDHIVVIILLRPAIASEQLESFSEHTYCFNDADMFMLRLDELIVALRERDSKRKSAAVTNSTALGLGRTRRDLRDINFRARAVSSSTRIRISLSGGAASFILGFHF